MEITLFMLQEITLTTGFFLRKALTFRHQLFQVQDIYNQCARKKLFEGWAYKLMDL